MKVKYQAHDGELFDTPEAARAYEQRGCKPAERDRLAEFFRTYNGKSLLNKYSMDTYGVWEIYGEDSNCDLGGHHHMPHLDTVEGTLQAAIEHGVKMPSFWQWGAGGDIRPAKAVTKL